MSESIENGFQTEFLEVLGYIINDIFCLSKEFEWVLGGEVNNNVKSRNIQVKTKNDYEGKFIMLRKYFKEEELEEYPKNLLKALDNILLELVEISIEVEKMSDEQKIKLVSFIKKTIKDNEKGASFKFSEKFKDMLFVELGIDHIDDIGDARDEMEMLLNKIMMNK